MKDGILSKPNCSRATYYSLQWTWGILMNIIGLFVMLYALIRKWPITKYRNAVLIETPSETYGGINFGMFLVIGKGQYRSAPHEYGHGMQNLNWGPLMPFVISLPSAIRFWYRELKYNRKGLTPPTKYDDIWFEKQATEYGKKAEANTWAWL